MINVSIFRNKDGIIDGFSVKGHACYSDYGKDIVCAGVSTIVQTTLASMLNMVGDCDYEQKSGKLILMKPKNLSEEQERIAEILFNSMFIGLTQMENNYSEYLSVSFKEV